MVRIENPSVYVSWNVRDVVHKKKQHVMAVFINTVALSDPVTSHGHIVVRAQRVIRGRARDPVAVGPSIRHLRAELGFCPSYRALGFVSGSNASH